jgi:serine/threonine-protein kinase
VSSPATVHQGDEISTGGADNEQFQDRLYRVRRSMVVAVLAWPAFGLLDWFICSFVSPGRLWFYLALRALGLVVLLVAALQIYAKKPPSPLRLRVIDSSVSALLTVFLTVSTLEFGGIASPLAMGVVVLLLCRSYVFIDHWKRGIVPVGLVVLAYPLTLLVMGVITPKIGDQFASSQIVSTFLLNFMFVATSGAIAVAGSHLIWTLKCQLYNSRALGRYKLKKRIGAGGMGEIWLAHHHALRRDVAVKILKPERAGNQQAIGRFEREVRATSELVHPNTVRVFDYGVTNDGLWYYAMEHLTGLDLHDEVSKNGIMDPQRAATLMVQAASALSEAHMRGIIHRDLKPENLFLTSLPGQGQFIKVLDFGLAKLMAGDPEIDHTLTQAGWAVGTPQWVSPEVVFGEQADARSDIYGLGAVLYFLLCGQSPFGQREMVKVMQAHKHRTPKRPSVRISREIHAGLEDIVMRCLAKDPNQRYQDARALANDLENCLARMHSEHFKIHEGDTIDYGEMDRTLSPELDHLTVKRVQAGRAAAAARPVEPTLSDEATKILQRGG